MEILNSLMGVPLETKDSQRADLVRICRHGQESEDPAGTRGSGQAGEIDRQRQYTAEACPARADRGAGRRRHRHRRNSAPIGSALTDHPARLMLWEGEPLPEIRERLSEMGIRVVVYRAMANRPAQGDFFSSMRANVDALAQALLPNTSVDITLP